MAEQQPDLISEYAQLEEKALRIYYGEAEVQAMNPDDRRTALKRCFPDIHSRGEKKGAHITAEKVNSLRMILKKGEEENKKKRGRDGEEEVSTDDLRKELLKFARDSMSDYCIGRANGEEYLQVKNKKEFDEVQAVHLKKKTRSQLEELKVLQKLIVHDKMHLMDKESMVRFEASGFCFCKDGTLVACNPR